MAQSPQTGLPTNEGTPTTDRREAGGEGVVASLFSLFGLSGWSGAERGTEGGPLSWPPPRDPLGQRHRVRAQDEEGGERR
jgi:hypothetical protein